MKPKTAILAAATLFVAWVAMPSAADDVTNDTGDPTPVRNDPAAPELVRTTKPGTTGVPKAQQPPVRSDDETPPAKAEGETPSAKNESAKTVRAADSLPQARAKGATNAYSAGVSRRAGLVVDSTVDAKRPRGGFRKVVGRSAAAPSMRRMGRGGSLQRVSSRAGMERPSRFAHPPATTGKMRRKAVLSTAAKNQRDAVQPPQVATPPQPPAADTDSAHPSVQQTTPAAKPVVTTVARQQQPTQPLHAIEPAPPLDEWEQYVVKTSAMYQFTGAQDAKARSILSDLKHRARQYQLTRGPAFQEAERLQDAGAQAVRLKELNRPIDLLFDELKQRLDNLPTIPQKLHAKSPPENNPRAQSPRKQKK